MKVGDMEDGLKLVTIVETAEDFEISKQTATEIISLLHEKHGDDLIVSLQSLEMAIKALLPELHN